MVFGFFCLVGWLDFWGFFGQLLFWDFCWLLGFGLVVFCFFFYFYKFGCFGWGFFLVGGGMLERGW